MKPLMKTRDVWLRFILLGLGMIASTAVILAVVSFEAGKISSKVDLLAASQQSHIEDHRAGLFGER